jgi:LPS export ABC transporter protein LptC
MSAPDFKQGLRKRKLLEYAAAIILAGAMVSLYFLGRSPGVSSEDFSSRAGLELQGPFAASRFEDSELRFWMKGDYFRYFPERGQAEVSEPAVEIQSGNGPVLVKSRAAQYAVDEKRIEMSGGVEITAADYQARTPSLSYDVERQTAESKETITVSGQGLELTGQGYFLDLNRGHVELWSGVKGRFRKQI